MSAHTKGPWVLDGEECLVGNLRKDGQHLLYVGRVDVAGRSGSIAQIQSADHVGGGITRDEAAANARLIAASPLLLDALEAIVKSLSDQDDEGMIEHTAQMVAARAAIAAARGVA